MSDKNSNPNPIFGSTKAGDYPALPAGVRSFDIRRFRRHHRNAEMRRINRHLYEQVEAAKIAKRAIANHLSRKEEEKARLMGNPLVKAALFVSQAMAKARALLGRRTN